MTSRKKNVPFSRLLPLLASLASPWLLLASAAASLAYVVHNRRFFGFLATRIKGVRLFGAILLHWIYHLYASAIFISVLVMVRIGRLFGHTRLQ